MRKFSHVTAFTCGCLLTLVPTSIWSQVATIDELTRYGVAFHWIPDATISYSKPDSTTSKEVQGYTAVLPRESSGQIIMFGFVLRTATLILSQEFQTLSLNKVADINGTPSNSADDVLVSSVQRTVNTVFLEFIKPIGWRFMLHGGFGYSTGTMKFKINSGGMDQNREFIFNNLTGIVGIDISANIAKMYPNINFFYYYPFKEQAFRATSSGLGVRTYLLF